MDMTSEEWHRFQKEFDVMKPSSIHLCKTMVALLLAHRLFKIQTIRDLKLLWKDLDKREKATSSNTDIEIEMPLGDD